MRAYKKLLSKDKAAHLMNIIIDGCAFGRTWQRGIQRYYFELLSRTPADLVVNMFFRKNPVAPVPSVIRLTEISEEYLLGRSKISERAFAKVRRLWFPTPYPNGDVFHSTYFTRSPHKGVPEVVTVHDMVPEVMPYFFEADLAKEIERKRDCIFAASKIIAISHSTAFDLASIYPEVSGRIEVIHSGAQHFPSVEEQDIGARVYDEQPYAVFVGDRRGYKNFASLMDAMTVSEWPKDVDLVVIGSQFSEGELLAIRFRGLESRIRLVVHPTDVEMRDLLTKASVFVFPSLIEGFGFPMVEAQALGVPVVASDTKIFREIGGEAFFPVSPLDPCSIGGGVRDALDPEARFRLTLMGIENVRRFSWDDCAAQTYRVWQEAARSGPIQ